MKKIISILNKLNTKKRDNKPKIGVSIILVNKKKNILLGLRKNGHGSNTWGMPGGHLEYGESFSDCAKREAIEELGIDIQCHNSPFHVTNDYFRIENKHYITVFILSTYKKGIIKNMEPEKCTEWKWFNYNKLPQNLFLPVENLIKEKDLKELFT